MKALFSLEVSSLFLAIALVTSCQTRTDAVKNGALKTPEEGIFEEYQPSPPHKRPQMKLFKQKKTGNQKTQESDDKE